MRLVHEPLSTNRTMKALINRLSHTPLGILLMSVMLYQAMPFSHNIAPAHAADTQVSPSKSSNQQVSDTKKKAQVDVPLISRMAKEKEQSASGVAQKHRTHKLIRRPATVQVQPAPSAAPGIRTNVAASGDSAMSAANGGVTDSTHTSSKDSVSTAPKGAANGIASTSVAGVLTPGVPMQIAPSTSLRPSSGSVSGSPSSSFAAAGGSSGGSGGSPGRNMQKLVADMPALAQILTPPSSPLVTTPPPPPSNPAIGVSPTSLSFTAQQGRANPSAQILSLSNTGGGTLSWSASDNAAWLTLSPALGTGNGTVTASVTTGTQAVGTYSGTVTLNATGATSVTVPVTFTVTAAPAPPAIGASPTSLSFTATQGGGNPATQTLSLSNTGGGTLSWSASDNAPWLILAPASGTGNGAVTLSVTTGSLTAGNYSGMITLSATGASSVTVPVIFTVTTAPVPPSIGTSPTSLSFSATQGGANPAAQTLSISNTGGGMLSWTASDNAHAPWLTLSPASGTGNGSATANVNTAGLTAGTYNASITITGTGATNTPQTVPVTLTVSVPTTSSATLTWNPNVETDLAGYKVYRAIASGTYGAPIATLQSTVTSYTSAGLLSGTTYFFVVTAYDSAGNESMRSNEVSKRIF